MTRAPSLRNVMNSEGEPNTPFMHTGNFETFNDVLEHYNKITVVNGNTNIDARLVPNGSPQKLHLTEQEKTQLTAFIKTLSGVNVYNEPKWSKPFVGLDSVNWERVN